MGARSETVLNDDNQLTPRHSDIETSPKTKKTTTGTELNPTSVVWRRKSRHNANGHRHSIGGRFHFALLTQLVPCFDGTLTSPTLMVVGPWIAGQGSLINVVICKGQRTCRVP